MDARPAGGVVLCLTKYLAGYWRDIPVTTENIADHIQYGIAFGPAEVSMWYSSGSIAQIDLRLGVNSILIRRSTLMNNVDSNNLF